MYRIIDGKAQRARVEIGQRRGGKAEVLKGLRDGDIVITAGQHKIRDGVPVQVAAVQNAPAAPPNADAGVIAAPSAPPAPPKGDAVPAAPAKADAAAPVPKS